MKRVIRRNKRAAVEMSFQFLFSIILVAVVLFVGFYVIRMFMNNAEKIKLLQAVQDVRDKVNSVSGSDTAQDSMEFKLNSNVKYICFSNASTCVQRPDLPGGFCNNISFSRGTMMNMFFLPADSALKYKVAMGHEIYCGSESQKKNCLNATQAKCFPVGLDGKFHFIIEKPNQNSLVRIRP